MSKTSRVNWPVLLFIILTPLVGIVGTVLLTVFYHVSAWTWLLFFVMWAVTGLSITAGYHRLFSHCSLQASWPVKLFFVCFGAATFQGSVIEWCTDHRNHHRYTDTDKDPYNIKKGFWYAHMGWLIRLDGVERDFSNVEDLLQDPLLRWAHKYCIPLMIAFGFIFPVLVAWCWGDPWGGLIIAGALRIAVGHHATWAINSVCHTFGKANYIEQTAKDNWMTAFITWGEGFHNYHHQFPIDYRNGIRWFHYDPSKWLIASLSWLRLAYGLKRVERSRALKYQLRFQMQALQAAWEHKAKNLAHGAEHFYHSLYDQLLLCLNKITLLENKIVELNKKKYHFSLDFSYKRRLRVYQHNLGQNWKLLQHSLKVWRVALRVPKRV